jgi:hypothetical protein
MAATVQNGTPVWAQGIRNRDWGRIFCRRRQDSQGERQAGRCDSRKNFLNTVSFMLSEVNVLNKKYAKVLNKMRTSHVL